MMMFWVMDSSASGTEKIMAEALEALIAKAKKLQMTEAQMREQRQSFVYGNTHIENSLITREMVAEADEKVAQEEHANVSQKK